MKIRLKKYYFLVLLAISVLFFFISLPTIFEGSFIKGVSADIYEDACLNTCINMTGDGPGDCAYLCSEDNTYGCYIVSNDPYFGLDPIYAENSVEWCKFVQTPTQLCVDSCFIVNRNFQYYGEKCQNSCLDAQGDSSLCETLAPSVGYFNDDQVDISFCSMLDVERPNLEGSIDIYFDTTYMEGEIGTQMEITGEIYSNLEITGADLITENGDFIDTCSIELLGGGFDRSFSCFTPSSDYNYPGNYYYKIRVYDINEGFYDSETSVEVYIMEEQEETPLLIPVPTKTLNNDFIIKGITRHWGDIIEQVTIDYNESTHVCTPDDGTWDYDFEKFTCHIENLQEGVPINYCVKVYDEFDIIDSQCGEITKDSNPIDNLIGYWPFNSQTLNVIELIQEVTGYGSLGELNSEGIFQGITDGYDQEAVYFDGAASLFMNDINNHYNFNGENDQFYVEAYVKTNSIQNSYPRIVGMMNYDQNWSEYPHFSWTLGLNFVGGIDCVIYVEGEGITQQDYRIETWDENTITVGEWNKIGCSWNAKEKELSAYLNDEKVGTTIVNQDVVIRNAVDGGIAIASKRNPDWGIADWFDGAIDEIKIYNTSTPPEGEEDPPVTEYFTDLDYAKLLKNTSAYNITGVAHHDLNISSIQYRRFQEGLGENDSWSNCSCTDGLCNSKNENFSCNLSGINNNDEYTYQIRIGYNSDNEYIQESDWAIIDIYRYDGNDLLAWWPFGNSSTLYDYSGNNINGEITGNNQTLVSSATGSRTNFFNLDTKVEIPDSFNRFNVEDVSKELRFELKVKPYPETSTERYALIYKPKQEENGVVWALDLEGTNVYSGIVYFQDEYTNINDPASLISNDWNRLRLAFSSPDQGFMIRANNSAPKISVYYNPFGIPSSYEPLVINANNNFVGEIDDIKVFGSADVKAPEVEFSNIGNLERLESSDIDIDVVVKDETGIDSFEYLFLQFDTGNNLDTEPWEQVITPTQGNWGDKELLFNIQKNNLEDGRWNLFVRATDSNGFKHLYTKSGWYTFVDFPTPSAMPYLSFVIEAQDTTPPFIYAHSIIPNPTVDRSPGVRGYVKDFLQEGVGDTMSNIANIQYKLNDGDWVDIPPLDGAYDSPMEEFFFKFEDLLPGEYTLRIRAEDTSGNSTDDNNTTHFETFTIYEPEIIPESSVIEKVEDFTTHTYHDVLFSDGVWGNGILRLRQEIEFDQDTEFFTNSNDFGWTYGDTRTAAFEALDGNLWILTIDNRLNYYDLNTKQYQKYPLLGNLNNRIEGVKEFQYQGRRYLMVSFSGAQANVIYDINNTPLDINDDPSFVSYYDKTDFDLYKKFSIIGFDTRNGKFAYYAFLNDDSEEGRGNFLIWIDTKGTIMDLEDDTYVVWGKDDELFYINENLGYQQEWDFTAGLFDQSENILYAASYNWSIYQCTDGGTPENKTDDSCQRFGYPNGTYGVFSIVKDTNGYYWFGGNEGLTRIHRNGTFDISDDEKIQVLTKEDLAYQELSQIKWVPGEYPVGDEIWMMTRNGYIKALEFNFTYNDTLDDTKYNYKIKNIFNRQGGFSQFVMTDRNTIYTSLQGYGLQKISLTRKFANTNRIEMLPIPPDGILAINYIDLEEVLGTVTAGSSRTFNELVSYEVSNDAGVTWYPITLGERVTFPTPDYKLKLRINLNRGSSPIIELIKLSYITYPDQDSGNQCDIKINSKSPAITSLVKSGNSIIVNFLRIFNEPNIENYLLQYGISNNNFQISSINISPLVSSYTIPNLNPNTEYFFRIKAITDCTESSWSNVLSAMITTEPIIPPIINPTTPPTRPPIINTPRGTSICGQPCSIDSDCSDANNICMNGICQLNANSCLATEKLDESKCSCVTKTSTGGMCGDSCVNDYQCTEKNNRCIDGKCKLLSCPTGSIIGNNGCGCFPLKNESSNSIGMSERIGDFFKNISPDTAKDISNLSLVGFFASYMLAFLTGGTYPMAYVLQGFTTILGGVKVRKKSQDYGMVYDSITKEPIIRAIVRIFDSENKLVATEVTNQFGIFEANLEKSGGYKIKVMARNYLFPSNIIRSEEDGIYQNIYTGGSFDYDPSVPINYSIPIDPLESGSREYTKAIFLNKVSAFFSKLQTILLILGFIFAVVSYVNNASILNIAVLGIYVLIGIISLVIYIKNRKKYGIVTDVNNQKLSNFTILLKELEFGKIHSQRITDEQGRYRFIVPGGKYRIELANSSYQIINQEDVNIDTNNEKISVVNKNLKIRRNSF